MIDLEAEIAALKAEFKLVKEFVTTLVRDRNPNGKTIIDFQAVWLDQERDENAKLRAKLELAKDALRSISSNLSIGLVHPNPDAVRLRCYAGEKLVELK